MSGRRGIWLVVGLFLALVTGIVLSRGLPPASPNPPGTFSFAVLGDAPYYPWEDLQYPLLLREINSYDLSWVVHVGDIFWHPCTDELYQRSLGWFTRLQVPGSSQVGWVRVLIKPGAPNPFSFEEHTLPRWKYW